MSEIEKRVRTQASNALKRLNPGFFNNTHQSMVEPSKPLISNYRKNELTSRSSLSDRFKLIWSILKGPRLEEEFSFHPGRKFRVDFCHFPSRTCIEIEGGIFNKRGGHSSVTGILRDIEKYNEMSFLGFRLFRFHGKEGVNGSIDVANLTRLIRFLERSS